MESQFETNFSQFEETEHEQEQKFEREQNPGFSSSPVHFTGLQTAGELTAFFRNTNLDEVEEGNFTVAGGGEETENEGEYTRNQRQHKKQGLSSNNFCVLKGILILILCLFLLNFVLVLVFMSWTTKLYSSVDQFSAQVNQTQENFEHFQQEFENAQKGKQLRSDQFKNWLNSTNEILRNLHQQLEIVKNDSKVQEVERMKTWRDVQTELARNISHSFTLLQKLENQTSRMDSDVQKFRNKFESPLKNFMYGDFSTATVFEQGFCGGVFNFSEVSILQYSRPTNSSYSSSCTWLVWSRAMTQIKMRLIHLNGQLTIYTNLQTDGRWTHALSLTSANVFQEKSVSWNIALLVFTPPLSSWSSSSLSSSSSSLSDPEFGIGFQQGSAFSGSSVYSIMSNVDPLRKINFRSIGYGNDERRFYIFYPPPGQKIQLNLETVDTEPTNDVIYTFTFGGSSSPQNFRVLASHSGTGKVVQLFTSRENQPIILFLVSNSRVVKTGFNASISTVH